MLIAAAALPLNAQIRGAGSPGSGAAVTAGFGIRGGAAGSAHFRSGRSFGRGPILYPYPYYYDSDFGYDAQGVAQPQVVVVPAAAQAQPAPPTPPLEPLLIEWQGDHFERMTLSQKIGGQAGPDYSEKSNPRSSTTEAPGPVAPARKAAAPTPPRELPPAVLVFRDGRTEEVSSYTIMSGTIYSKADYWTSGSWTRKIQIADLDVPATLKQNQQRGVKFVLPSGPNEVVMRP